MFNFSSVISISVPHSQPNSNNILFFYEYVHPQDQLYYGSDCIAHKLISVIHLSEELIVLAKMQKNLEMKYELKLLLYDELLDDSLKPIE